jgi:hypothetical protein
VAPEAPRLCVDRRGYFAAATKTLAAPVIPARLGWIGADGLFGTRGSTQRTDDLLQASCPMLAWYQSTKVAPFAAA